MSGILHGAMIASISAAVPKVLTWKGSDVRVAPTGGSVFTWTSKDIGTADASRRVHLIVDLWEEAGTVTTISSVTIGGVSATSNIEISINPSGYGRIGIFTAAVPTGTTADIVVTTNRDMTHGPGIGWWISTGLTSSTPSNTYSQGSADPLSASVVVPSGGFAIAGIASRTGSSGTWTWTGATERYDALVTNNAGNLWSHSGADLTASATVQGDSTQNDARQVYVAAAWG